MTPLILGEGRASLYLGDCLALLREFHESSIDAVVCDPPSGISFMGREWDSDRGGRDQWVSWLSARLYGGFLAAKPGAYALVWALPRTSHWTALAIEDAGWRVVDRVSHLFSTGFPKHQSKLKPACEDWWLAWKPADYAVRLQIDSCRIGTDGGTKFGTDGGTKKRNKPIGKQNGIYGDGLHGKCNVISLNSGRYPANIVFSHHPACVPIGTRSVRGDARLGGKGKRPGGFGNVGATGSVGGPCGTVYGDEDGRETIEVWECHPDCVVFELDRQSGFSKSTDNIRNNSDFQSVSKGSEKSHLSYGHSDAGGASRFFYVAKASKYDRGPGNNHPTVKNSDLMRYLIRLIAPPNSLVLDFFMGSGSTGKAAILENFRFVGCECDPEFFGIAYRRIRDAVRSADRFPRPGPVPGECLDPLIEGDFS